MAKQKVYRVDRDILECRGSQTFEVVAKTPEMAFKMLQNGEGEVVGHDPDVQRLSKFDISDLYEDEVESDYPRNNQSKLQLMDDPRKVLRPSMEIWTYYKGEITVSLIVSSIADVIGGFHICYSANELLKDLNLITPKGRINKRGREVLAQHVHWAFHSNTEAIKLIDPTSAEGKDI